MARWMKRLPCKHENLAACTYNTCTERWNQVNAWGSHTSLPGPTGELQASA